VSNEKVEFAKLVDASATMGANLTLAMGEKNGCRCRQTLRLMFYFGNNRTTFTGLLFVVRGTS
jgi:hypothetical protein